MACSGPIPVSGFSASTVSASTPSPGSAACCPARSAWQTTRTVTWPWQLPTACMKPQRPEPELAGTGMRGIARNGLQLWFGCGRRLCVEDHGRVSIFGPAEGLPEDAWDAIATTPDGSVWTRSPSKLYRKPPGAGQMVQENADIASSIDRKSLVAGKGGA